MARLIMLYVSDKMIMSAVGVQLFDNEVNVLL